MTFRKGNNLTIFTEKTANISDLKEGIWHQRQNFMVDSATLAQSATQKNLSPKNPIFKGEKKYQTQVIKNAIRNLVRKKQSPSKKIKQSKSKNHNESIKKRSSVTKPAPDSIRTSKSRKMNKLFSRKNLSVSIDNRKMQELNKLQDLVFSSTMKNPMIIDYRALSRPSTVKNRERLTQPETVFPGQLSLQGNHKIALANMPVTQMDGYRCSKRGH